MKKLSTITLLMVWIAGLLCSCSGPWTEPETNRVYVLDGNWKPDLYLSQVSVKPSSDRIEFYVLAKCDRFVSNNLYSLVCYGSEKELKKCSETEIFAFQRITERTSTLKSEFDKHFPDSYGHSLHLTTLFMRSSPTVIADKLLFGKEPGEDLSAFFKYSGSSSCFRICDLDYKIVDSTQPQLFQLTDYFSEGTIVPHSFYIYSVNVPKELSQDDDVNLTFTFPVTRELYWTWLFDLYENPDAEELFIDMNITLKANLKNLIVFDSDYPK